MMSPVFVVGCWCYPPPPGAPSNPHHPPTGLTPAAGCWGFPPTPVRTIKFGSSANWARALAVVAIAWVPRLVKFVRGNDIVQCAIWNADLSAASVFALIQNPHINQSADSPTTRGNRELLWGQWGVQTVITFKAVSRASSSGEGYKVWILVDPDLDPPAGRSHLPSNDTDQATSKPYTDHDTRQPRYPVHNQPRGRANLIGAGRCSSHDIQWQPDNSH